MKIFDA
jgi:hypothetical protein